MSENKKPDDGIISEIPDIIRVSYVDYDGVPNLENLSRSQLALLLSENKGRVPIDAEGNPMMCYAIDARERWTGTDSKPVMCYAMPAWRATVNKRKRQRVMCYKRMPENRKPSKPKPPGPPKPKPPSDTNKNEDE